MKKKFLTFCTLSLLLIAFVACSDKDLPIEQPTQESVIELRSAGSETTHYYWYRGERIYLTVNTDYVHAIMNDGFRESTSSNSLFEVMGFDRDNSEPMQGGMVKLRLRPEESRLRSASALSVYSETVDALIQSGVVNYVFPFFERGAGVPPIGTSYIFYVKLKTAGDIAKLQEVAVRHNVQIIDQVFSMPLWHVLSVQGAGFRNSIEASNYFFETGYFCEIDPAFMFNFAPSCVNNRLWGLRNIGQNSGRTGVDINVCRAWTITSGAGVNVAVIDHGISQTHMALIDNLCDERSFDAMTRQPVPRHLMRQHGTLVAGIIAASRNHNLPVVGVAPESTIININQDFATNPWGVPNTRLGEQLVDGINWAWENGADIINNSWGDQGGDDRYYQFRKPILRDAITNAITRGRNGLGTVVVFASGNQGTPNRISRPGTFHPEIIVVGAINSDGRRWSGSNRGAELDVVAPGVNILSTCPHNVVDYDTGTSFAAPMVSGVAALMLSVNPSLRAEDVRRIINRTANRSPNVLRNVTFPANPPAGRPAPWINEVGHGLVDAYAAVREAIGLRPVISGYPAVCLGTTNAAFSIPTLPTTASVRWVVDAPLAIVGDNNLRTVTVRHTGATAPASSRLRAEISLNGRLVHTVVLDVAVNRPVITSITPSSAQLHTGAGLLFSVNHSGTSLTWSVTPNAGVNIIMVGGANARHINFMNPGHHTVSVTSVNACGSSETRHVNVHVTGNPHNAWCPICAYYPLPQGTPCPRCNPPWSSSVLLEEEEEEVEE